MGANHSSGRPIGRWYEVDETFAVMWGIQRYSVRLLKAQWGPTPVLRTSTYPSTTALLSRNPRNSPPHIALQSAAALAPPTPPTPPTPQPHSPCSGRRVLPAAK